MPFGKYKYLEDDLMESYERTTGESVLKQVEEEEETSSSVELEKEPLPNNANSPYRQKFSPLKLNTHNATKIISNG